jgi:transcriptional regulator with XRE-family HTH domain
MSKGDRLKMRLKDVGMSQAKLARKVGVSQSTVSQWVKGSTLNFKNDNMLYRVAGAVHY